MAKKAAEIPQHEQVILEPELEEALKNATDAEMCDIAGETASFNALLVCQLLAPKCNPKLSIRVMDGRTSALPCCHVTFFFFYLLVCLFFLLTLSMPTRRLNRPAYNLRSDVPSATTDMRQDPIPRSQQLKNKTRRAGRVERLLSGRKIGYLCKTHGPLTE